MNSRKNYRKAGCRASHAYIRTRTRTRKRTATIPTHYFSNFVHVPFGRWLSFQHVPHLVLLMVQNGCQKKVFVKREKAHTMSICNLTVSHDMLVNCKQIWHSAHTWHDSSAIFRCVETTHATEIGHTWAAVLLVPLCLFFGCNGW